MPADFNGDRLHDVLLYQRSTGEWFQCLNTGGSAFTYTTGNAWSPGLGVFAGDFNGDGKDDVFTYDASSGNWTEFLAGGTTGAGFVARSGAWSPGWSVYPVTLDSDRLTDLFIYDPDTGAAYECRSTDGAEAFVYRREDWSPGWRNPSCRLRRGRPQRPLPVQPRQRRVVRLCDGADQGWDSQGTSAANGHRRGTCTSRTSTGTAEATCSFTVPWSGVYFRCLTVGNGQFSYTSGAWDPEWTIVSEMLRVPAATPTPGAPPPSGPPAITSLTTSSDRAEADTEVTLWATVEDDVSPSEQLIYEWSAAGGTFSGTGGQVTWRAPSGPPTPATYVVTLTVIERYSTAVGENRTSASVTIHVNDSGAEVRDLSLTFLGDFVDSTKTPATCVRNFSDSCSGKADELSDITKNRAMYVIDSSASWFSIRGIAFNGGRTAAHVNAPCHFESIIRATGATEKVEGVCTLTAVYEDWRWWLCESHFTGSEIPFKFFF